MIDVYDQIQHPERHNHVFYSTIADCGRCPHSLSCMTGGWVWNRGVVANYVKNTIEAHLYCDKCGTVGWATVESAFSTEELRGQVDPTDTLTIAQEEIRNEYCEGVTFRWCCNSHNRERGRFPQYTSVRYPDLLPAPWSGYKRRGIMYTSSYYSIGVCREIMGVQGASCFAWLKKGGRNA